MHVLFELPVALRRLVEPWGRVLAFLVEVERDVRPEAGVVVLRGQQRLFPLDSVESYSSNGLLTSIVEPLESWVVSRVRVVPFGLLYRFMSLVRCSVTGGSYLD